MSSPADTIRAACAHLDLMAGAQSVESIRADLATIRGALAEMEAELASSSARAAGPSPVHSERFDSAGGDPAARLAALAPLVEAATECSKCSRLLAAAREAGDEQETIP